MRLEKTRRWSGEEENTREGTGNATQLGAGLNQGWQKRFRVNLQASADSIFHFDISVLLMDSSGAPLCRVTFPLTSVLFPAGALPRVSTACPAVRRFYSHGSLDKESLDKEFDPRSAGAARNPGCAGVLLVP